MTKTERMQARIDDLERQLDAIKLENKALLEDMSQFIGEENDGIILTETDPETD